MRGREDRAGVAAGEGWALKPGRAFALLPLTEGETERSPAGFIAPLRKALIEGNRRHVNVFVSEEDYRTLKRGIGNLGPGVQRREGSTTGRAVSVSCNAGSGGTRVRSVGSPTAAFSESS